MQNTIHSVITGTGSYIPDRKVTNADFLDHTFLDTDGTPFDKTNEEIIQKFGQITGIEERRYADDDIMTSDMGADAGRKALEAAGLDPNELDYIIVGHNFGDIRADNPSVDMVPSLASRVKNKLGITNPGCIAYDLPFGCPGWVQGLIQSDYYLRSGDATSSLVIGAETLSRVCDPHDRDSMIYADGAGAVVLQARNSDTPMGILSHASRTDTEEQAHFLRMEPSYHRNGGKRLFLKMDGRKLYQYALTHVPGVVQSSICNAGVEFSDIKKVLIHQANAKMDEAIMKRIAKLYGLDEAPEDIMPMTISKLGNSSVATVPTLLDLIVRKKMGSNHRLNSGDTIILASVGAGMNINSVVYKLP